MIKRSFLAAIALAATLAGCSPAESPVLRIDSGAYTGGWGYEPEFDGTKDASAMGSPLPHVQ